MQIGTDSLLQPSHVRVLKANLAARRRLPPNATVARPSQPTQQALLDDLLHLPDDVDPVRWLAEHRVEAVARFALSHVLRTLEREYRATSDERRRQELPRDLRGIWDDHARSWTNRESGAVPFGEPTAADDDAGVLRTMLRRVRAIRPRYAGPSGRLPDGDLPRLIENLLTLPDEADPLDWIGQHAAALGAVLLLRSLLRAAPVSGRAVGRTHQQSPNLKAESRGPVGHGEFILEEITLDEQGITVVVAVSVSIGDIVRPPGVDYLLFQWNGFDRVRDDRDCLYIGGPSEMSMLHGHADAFRVIMRFAPGVDEEVAGLTLSASPVVITVVGLGQGESVILREIEWEDLAWHISLRA